MKLLAEFSHPAQVHKFKNVFRGLADKGHETLVLSRDKDVMIALLEAEGIPHKCLTKARVTLLGLAFELLLREIRVLWEFIKFRPDIVLSAHSVAITHSGWLFRIPRIVHDDTEHATLQQSLYMPFATHIVTSTAYLKDLGSKQIKINSLEPLAYLHPDHFSFDHSVIKKYNLKQGEKYAVLRFVSWNAAHDVGLKENSFNVRKALFEQLFNNGYSKIVLTSEALFADDPRNNLRNDPRIILINPEDLHQILAGASICVTEGGSVAYESSVLGIPTIYANPLQTGIADELIRFGLIVRVHNLQDALHIITKLANDPNTNEQWAHARQKLLKVKSNMALELEAVLLSVAENMQCQ